VGQAEAKDYGEMADKRAEAFLIGEKGRSLKKMRPHLFRRSSSVRASSSGFTFVEMIIIITIIAILAGAAIYKGWGSTNPNALKVAVDQVITDMRFAQTVAMANSANVQVSFVNGSRNYVVGTEARQLPSGVIASTTKNFTFNMLGEYPETNEGYLTLSAGASTRRVRLYTVTSFVEEN
jgi:Tfp pilus assembly protein FimT